MTANADRARCGEAYGTQPPPPSVLGKHQPNTSRREPGRRCPLRRTTRCCGRGEAAGDCVSTAELFFDGVCRPRTARTGYASCSSPGVCTPARSDGEHRPGSKTRVQERWESKTLLRRNRDMWSSDRFARYGRSRKKIVHVAYGGIVVRDFFQPGTPGGMEQLLWDQRSSSGETPEVAMARQAVPFFMTLGRCGVPETRPGRRHRSWSCRSGNKRRS